MKMPESYEAAQSELQTILQALQQPNASIDELQQHVDRAKTLITWCRERLRKTEAAVTSLFQELSDEGGSPN